MGDSVDVILDQWRRQRPDLDAAGMGLVGRLMRANALVHRHLDHTFGLHGLAQWEFDVLATLRRSGPPFRLSVGGLLSGMMITSGTMTNRVDRLEQRGYVVREPDPADRRCVLVRLTDTGLELIDQVVAAHVRTVEDVLSPMDAEDRQRLTALLRDLLLVLGDSLTEEP